MTSMKGEVMRNVMAWPSAAFEVYSLRQGPSSLLQSRTPSTCGRLKTAMTKIEHSGGENKGH